MTVSSLGYLGIETTDLEKWREFATSVLGLMVNSRSSATQLYLQMDDRPFRIVVSQGDQDRLVFSGWEFSDKNRYEAVLARLESAGHAVERCQQAAADERCVTALARTYDPDGNQLELFYGRIYDYDQFISPAGVSGFVTGNMGLGHVVLPAPSLAQCHAFYTDLLGFHDSDYMDIHMAPSTPPHGLHFLHCDNPRHHSLAILETPHPAGAIHIMLEVNHLDDVGRALDRCQEHGVHITASLGRHTNDLMTSFYLRCPAGFEIEYGCGGWQVDWDTFVPTYSRKQSFWGHKFSFPEAG